MSTYGPVQLPAYFSSSADFQAWVQGIHNALAAIGLTQTADTGQINPASVALPGAANTAAGYEIWRLNDALQATSPFFFKIEYGTGASALGSTPSLWITVGASTNGAGTLGAPTAPRQQIAAIAGKSAGNTNPLYASGDGSRFALCVNADAFGNSYPMWIACERTRDASGSYTADGLLAVVGSSSTATNWLYAVVPPLGSSVSGAWRNSVVPVLPVNGFASGSVHQLGANAGLGTLLYFLGVPFSGLSLTAVARNDVGGVWGGTFQAAVLGALHTYLTLLAFVTNYASTGDQNSEYLCLLWE